jgi:hypothetical protein
MNDMLHDELLALGPDVEWPPTPDVAVAVCARIAVEPAPVPARRSRRARARRVRRVAVVVAIAAVAAIPPARAAVLRLLGIEGVVQIVRVERLPLQGVGQTLDLGDPVALDTARALVPFRVRLPTDLGPPREVRFSQAIAGGAVSVRYGHDLVLTQFQGDAMGFIKKVAGPGTRVREVAVDGATGFFLSGAPHETLVADRYGQAVSGTATLVHADVLLWRRGDVAYRLESTRGLTATLAVADALR